MPGVSGVTVVTNARAFYTTRAAAGASGARHSLRPLFSEGRTISSNLAQTCCEIVKLCLQMMLFEIDSGGQKAPLRRAHHPSAVSSKMVDTLSSFALPPSLFLLRSSSFALPPSLFLLRSSSFALPPSLFLLRSSSFGGQVELRRTLFARPARCVATRTKRHPTLLLPHSCHRWVKNCRAKERFSPRISRYISAQPSSDCKSISGVGRARRVSSSTHRALGRVNRVAERHANPAYRWRALGYFANPLNATASRSFIRGLSARIFQLLMLSSKRPPRPARHANSHPVEPAEDKPNLNQVGLF
jgi:hypothetical protein